jgi:hypothetical protein
MSVNAGAHKKTRFVPLIAPEGETFNETAPADGVGVGSTGGGRTHPVKA